MCSNCSTRGRTASCPSANAQPLSTFGLPADLPTAHAQGRGPDHVAAVGGARGVPFGRHSPRRHSRHRPPGHSDTPRGFRVLAAPAACAGTAPTGRRDSSSGPWPRRTGSGPCARSRRGPRGPAGTLRATSSGPRGSGAAAEGSMDSVPASEPPRPDSASARLSLRLARSHRRHRRLAHGPLHHFVHAKRRSVPVEPLAVLESLLG